MKIKILFTALIIGLSISAHSQSRSIEKARESFRKENYAESSELCAEAYTKLTRKGKLALKMKGEMAFLTAESYRQIEDYREAEKWYEKSVLVEYYNVVPEVYLHRADMLVIMKDYEKAIASYEDYLKLVPGSPLAEAGIASCKDMKTFEAEKTRHIIENQTAINKAEFDMAPMFGDRKTKKLYFSSSRDGSTGTAKDPRTGEAYMDLWVSELDKKGNWTEPYKVEGEGINTEHNEGTVAFDNRYKFMFFTRCPHEKKMNLGCDIYMAEAKSKTEWKEPVLLNLKPHDSISVGHPATMDGKFLVFASDLPGGYGGKDLWITTYDKRAETWSTPVNLGPEINTKGDELFPTFNEKGEMYFATDGRPGLGGLDIFKATRVGEDLKWENPVNLGSPINSYHNDYSLVEEDYRSGYFTSERKSANGENKADIFSYYLPPNLYSLKVNVTELVNKTAKIEGAKVVIKGSDNSTWEGYTMANGSVYWDKRPVNDANFGDRYINEDVTYQIMVSKEGYHEDQKGSMFTTEGLEYGQDFVIDMSLIPQTPIRLPEVRYALNSWELMVDSTINSRDSLLFVYNLLEEYPGMVLELSSHTDSRGSATANQKLSENRARACYKYLVETKGVDPRRLIPVGKGENASRKVWTKDGEYAVDKPADMTGWEEVILTEKYINSFRTKDKKTFELLHQLNRRTEGDVKTMTFDPSTAPAADPKYLKYVKYP